MNQPPKPNHVAGTSKGEELVRKKGREPGRGGKHGYRSARDSTSIGADAHGPIDPRMPDMPPA
ncbi:MAG TPA: hypothetical protein VG433_01050 [Pirellulales bacterium]|jgi:hypothetical protein|nr:hypothetical protein [Pirellulales bacterium]HWC88203.1 hypothetical protein [Pirellulales bacterium]